MRVVLLPLTLLVAAAMPGRAADAPEPADPVLRLGRTVWLSTCEACHANALSDAPQVKDKAAWAPRLAKGAAALHASALNGRVGSDGAEMPPRGGNVGLSDAEVKAAVNYMMSIANH